MTKTAHCLQHLPVVVDYNVRAADQQFTLAPDHGMDPPPGLVLPCGP